MEFSHHDMLRTGLESGTEVFLALGSNLGDRGSFFRFAVQSLTECGFIVKQISPVYETDPVDCEDGVPPFWNCVLSGFWHGTPEALLHECQQIERRAGRPAEHSSRQSRNLDIDLILFGHEIIDTASLTVPHPRAHQRFFVMIPLCDLAPGVVFPVQNKTARDLLAQLGPISGIRPAAV